MNDAPDLGTALTQIAQGATRSQAARASAGGDLPIAAIHAAARRRRAGFQTGVGLGAAAAVGALALGGAALRIGDGNGTAPAATDSWDVDYAACGTVLDVGDPGDQTGPALLVPGTSFPTDSNALVTVASTARGGGGATLEQVGTQHTGVALDFAGNVVGVLGVPADGSAGALVPADEASLTLTTTAPIFSCRVQDGSARLEAGMYLLSVSRTVEVVNGGAAEQQKLTAQWDFTVPPAPTGVDAEALPTTALASAPLSCGQPLELADGTPGPLTIGMIEPPMESFGSGLVDVSANFIMTNPSDREIDVEADGARLVLTRGGIVVGFSSRGGPGYTFAPDTARVGLDSVLYSLGCPAGLMPSGAQSGDYELWVVVGVEDGPTSDLVAGPWLVDVNADPAADAGASVGVDDSGVITVEVPED